MIISSYDELHQLVTQAASGESEIKEITFNEEMVFTIKLKGDKWDGLVDYDVANFVLDIQSSINSLYKHLAYDQPKYKRIPKDISNDLKVKVKIEFGCSLFDIKLGKSFNALIHNMSGTNKTILGTTICLLICGTIYGISYNNSKAEIEKIKENNKHNVEVVKVLDKAIDHLAHSYKAIDNLTNSMDEKDEIEFVGTDKVYPKNAIRMKVQPSEQVEFIKYSHCVDGEYEILRIYKDSDEVYLKIDDYPIVASTDPLADKDKATLHDVFKEAHLKKDLALLDLQVVINIKNKSFLNAYVVGIGTPRKESVSVEKALSLPPKIKAEDLPLVQLSQDGSR